MNLAFVGFKHRHTGAIYQEAMADPNITVLGAWEDTEEGRALADGLGLAFNYPTLESVLNDPRVDAVCLGGSFGERGGEAIAALRAGKHVYADKPVCTSLAEIDEIEALASAKHLKVGCYLTLRFSGHPQSPRNDCRRNTRRNRMHQHDRTASSAVRQSSDVVFCTRTAWRYDQ